MWLVLGWETKRGKKVTAGRGVVEPVRVDLSSGQIIPNAPAP